MEPILIGCPMLDRTLFDHAKFFFQGVKYPTNYWSGTLHVFILLHGVLWSTVDTHCYEIASLVDFPLFLQCNIVSLLLRYRLFTFPVVVIFLERVLGSVRLPVKSMPVNLTS